MSWAGRAVRSEGRKAKAPRIHAEFTDNSFELRQDFVDAWLRRDADYQKVMQQQFWREPARFARPDSRGRLSPHEDC
jgi:hypothetical protein